jgi:hypothetical protein
MRLQQLHELVCDSGRAQVHGVEEPIIRERNVVPEKAVGPQRIPTQGLHDEQVVQLVPLLGVMHLSQLGTSPPPERLVQVQHGHVREVRDAGDDFEEPKALDRTLVEEIIQEQAANVVEGPRDGVGVDLAASSFAPLLGLRDGLVGEGKSERVGRPQWIFGFQPGGLGGLNKDGKTLLCEVFCGELPRRRRLGPCGTRGSLDVSIRAGGQDLFERRQAHRHCSWQS